MSKPKKRGKKAVKPGRVVPAGGVVSESHSDHLIDEVAAGLGDDAPVMLALHQIKKRRRLIAKLARRVEEIDPLLRRLDAAEKAGVLGKSHADTLELIADIEEFLRDFAQDPDEFDEWAEDASDTQLVALLASFARGLRPGEASSSSR